MGRHPCTKPYLPTDGHNKKTVTGASTCPRSPMENVTLNTLINYEKRSTQIDGDTSMTLLFIVESIDAPATKMAGKSNLPPGKMKKILEGAHRDRTYSSATASTPASAGALSNTVAPNLNSKNLLTGSPKHFCSPRPCLQQLRGPQCRNMTSGMSSPTVCGSSSAS